jgi:predicted alpha/beta-hydrolase family hydrolase
MTDILADGADDARVAILLAHGAGAPMDSPYMTAIAGLVAGHGLRVLRFEFPYMAARRETGRRLPPPRAESLSGFFRDVVAEVARPGRCLLIGGKSMGGRIAAMIADDLGSQGLVHGLVCLGFPFHPTGKPERLRTADLEQMSVPTLICQGERDPFGTRAEVQGYGLSTAVRLHWLADGDHDLAPRKASGRTRDDNWSETAAAIAAFAAKT